MTTNFQKVIDFNRCFGHFISDTEYHNVFTEKPDLVKLKYSLINEEVEELTEAHENNDFVEIIDALSDIKYVLYGMACAFGIDMDQIFKQNICKICQQYVEFLLTFYQKFSGFSQNAASFTSSIFHYAVSSKVQGTL